MTAFLALLRSRAVLILLGLGLVAAVCFYIGARYSGRASAIGEKPALSARQIQAHEDTTRANVARAQAIEQHTTLNHDSANAERTQAREAQRRAAFFHPTISRRHAQAVIAPADSADYYNKLFAD